MSFVKGSSSLLSRSSKRQSVPGSRGSSSQPSSYRTYISPAQSLRKDIIEWQSMRMLKMQCSSLAEADTPATAAPAAASAPPAEPDVSALDIRVGKIMQCAKHPDAESLYVEEIDVGEPELRTIVSGLVQFVPLEKMQDRKVLVLCNLKSRNMRGVKSHGMVLCASNSSHDVVEPLSPPADALVGERVWFGDVDQATQPPPLEANRVQKKKVWEALQPLLVTDASGVAGFKQRPMQTSAGPVTAPSFPGASIS